MWLIDYFKEDPLRLLTLLGGTGGLVYWYDRIKNRLRIKIRFLVLNTHLINNKPYSITFEANNIGDMPTSIESTIILKGYIPSIMKKIKTSRFKKSLYTYEIDSSQNRHLPLREPIQFTAICSSKDYEKPFLILGFYIFTLTVGKKRIIYIQKEGKSQISLLKYLFYEAIYWISNDLYINKFIS